MSLQCAAIEDANEAVRSATRATTPRGRQREQTDDIFATWPTMASSLTMHRYSERVGSAAIFTLAWQFLTNNSSPDILVDMVASHHCLN